MKIYHIHRKTNEYTGSTEAREDPMERGRYLIPAHATTDAPPETPKNYTAVWVNEGWNLVEDYRGKFAYDKKSLEKRQIVDLGPIPSHLTIYPPDGLKSPIWDEEKGWVEKPVDAVDIKSEAGRRILALMPEWKQRNYTARMTELLKIRTVNGTWTAKEQAEVGFLEGEWAKAKAIREASDTIEAMNPIPVDYTNDKYWP